MNRLLRSHSVWAWVGLGLVGSVVLAGAGPAAVASPGTGWWYATPHLPGGRSTADALVYVGLVLLSAGWLGLGRHLAQMTPRALAGIAAVWMLPLAVGPALFSQDVYSYLAQGTVLHLGRNPYHASPAILASLGRGHVLTAVSPFWRHVTAPYGPLFLGLVSVLVGVTGSHLVAGVLAVRIVELVGVALIAAFVPRLAQALGADPVRALWLALLSPLLMVELVGAAHNDVLMVGVLVAGLAAALRGRPVLGIALCVLAATIKVPALAGAAFILVAWLREEPSRAGRWRLLANGGLSAAAVLAAVSAVTGLGFSWLSSSLFAAPARVRLAITPSTELGYTASGLLHDLGLSANAHAVEAGFAKASTVLVGVLALWLLYRVRIPKLALYVGLLLLAAAAGGPAAWPWYFSWGVVLLAACPGVQRSWALATAVVVAVFVIKPDGILALPLPTAPIVLAVYVVLAGLFWRSRRGGHGGDRGLPRTGRPREAGRRAADLVACLGPRGSAPPLIRASR